MSLIHAWKGHVSNSVHHITNGVCWEFRIRHIASVGHLLGISLARYEVLKLCLVVIVLFLVVQQAKSTKFHCFEYLS
jgi:hypothetical protein